MMATRSAGSCAVLALLISCGVLPFAGGCATHRNPWRFVEPPTAVDPVSAMRNERKTVVVVGFFGDPSRAPNYSLGVGRFMSDAYSRALLNDGKYDVWINPQITTAVEQIVSRPPAEHAAELAQIHEMYPKVHFVVLGKVTDFHHTGDLPAPVSRRGLFGLRNEAIVAVDFRIVDLRTRRVVGAHHLTATAPAGRTVTHELYGGVALDSYLFWSTPLGHASKEVVQSAVSRTEALVPPVLLGEPQIQHAISHRRLSISGGSLSGVAVGQELFVLNRPPGETRWVPVRDVDSGQPLTVRIETVTRTSSTAWLMGEHSPNVGLRGAVLAAELPSAYRSPARPAGPGGPEAAAAGGLATADGLPESR